MIVSVKFKPVYRKVSGGFIGFVEDLPGANAQGATIDDVRASLAEAIELILDANLKVSEESTEVPDVIPTRSPHR